RQRGRSLDVPDRETEAALAARRATRLADDLARHTDAPVVAGDLTRAERRRPAPEGRVDEEDRKCARDGERDDEACGTSAPGHDPEFSWAFRAEALDLLVRRRDPPVRAGVPVIAAERARSVLRQRVAVALAVRGAEERRDHLEIPFAHAAGLAPEVGEAEVDVQLEQLDACGSLGHARRPYSCRRTT